MDAMDYRVLGQVQVAGDGAPLRGRRPRDVLAFLLARRSRPLAPDVILDAVWDNEAYTLDVSVVHTVIARLRRVLGADAIRRHDNGYQLDPQAHVDADEFTRLLSAARTLVPDRQGEIVALLRRALSLWTGPEAYSGVSDSLVATERPRLHELRDSAIEQLAERLLLGGSPDDLADVVDLTAQLCRREPLREHAHEILMAGLYRTGRQADALAAYEKLRRGLRTELGIDPQPATAQLYARILAQEDIAPAARVRPIAAGSARVSHPARPRTEFVGRAVELARLRELYDGARPLISVIGPGGVGKSRLLAEFATDLPAESTVYVELPCVGATTPAEIAEAIARARGLTLAAGDPVPALAAALRSSSVTLLIDEAEWAVEAIASVVDQVTAQAPRVRVVLTSRVPLGLTGESRVGVAPLATPSVGMGAADVEASDAVQLLIARLRDQAPELTLDRADLDRIAEIARRVDGLPLALELVAGQASSSSVPDLLALVDAPLDIEAAEQDREPRQRSLRETLTWSIERLHPDAQIVLARLGVFAGSFDMATATAVVGSVGNADVPALIRSLIREAHVQIDRRDGRLRMRLLRTVQCLAFELLTESGDLDQVRRRHREWFAGRWRDQPLSDALIADVVASYADYVAALQDALTTQHASTCGDVAITLARYWFFVETGAAGLRWVQAALASNLLTHRQRAILRMMAVALQPQDSDGQNRTAALDALIEPLADDADWLGRLHILRSVGPYVHGDFEQALACAQQAVALARDRAQHHLPEALGACAVMLAALGRAQEATRACGEAWQLIAAGPSATDLTQVVPKIGLALVDSGQPRQALDILTATLETVERELGLAPQTLFTINAGWAALGCGEDERALHWFAHGIDQLIAGGDLVVVGELLSGAGAALAGLGSVDAEAVLAAGAAHLAAAGAVLTPWQDGQVRERRRVAKIDSAEPGPAAAVLAGTLDLGRLAALVTSAAR